MPRHYRSYKEALYGHLASVGKTLSSGPRLQILDLLAQGPRTVESIAGQIGQSVANTSHHLQVLRRARLVEAEKEGVHVTYRLADDGVAEAVRALRELAESRLLEIREVMRQFLRERGLPDPEPVDREALVGRVRRGEVTVLDVRPEEEYRAGHLPGALSIPLAEIERRLAELPRGREVVAYCRGPYCVMAVEAVAALRARGFRALPMEDGVVEWRARGLPVEVGPAE